MNDQSYFLDAMGITQWQPRQPTAPRTLAHNVVRTQGGHMQKATKKAQNANQPTETPATPLDAKRQATPPTATALPTQQFATVDAANTQRSDTDKTNQAQHPSTERRQIDITTQTAIAEQQSVLFACNLYVIIDNAHGVCLVGDIAEPDVPTEVRLLDKFFARLGGSGNYVYQGLFHWPISDAFADKNSAEQALSGLLSNWTNRRFLVALGTVAVSLLAPNEDHKVGACYTWQSVPLLVSHDAHSLLLNTQLRHDTWAHCAPIREAEKSTPDV